MDHYDWSTKSISQAEDHLVSNIENRFIYGVEKEKYFVFVVK